MLLVGDTAGAMLSMLRGAPIPGQLTLHTLHSREAVDSSQGQLMPHRADDLSLWGQEVVGLPAACHALS